MTGRKHIKMQLVIICRWEGYVWLYPSSKFSSFFQIFYSGNEMVLNWDETKYF